MPPNDSQWILRGEILLGYENIAEEFMEKQLINLSSLFGSSDLMYWKEHTINLTLEI